MKTRREFLATLAGGAAFALVACAGKSGGQSDGHDAKGDGVMSYADYKSAPIDSEVTIEAFVQGKQAWWDNTASLYLQDADGAYFVYGAACSEEDYAKLVEGQKVKIKGYKAEWSGEVEITDGTIEIEDGNWIAPALDVTDKLGTDQLSELQNQKVAFKGLEIAPVKKENLNDAYLYNYDGSGSEGDDLYFKVKKGDQTYSFTVESYLCDKDSDVYKKVKELKVGDKVDMEGFLYWYEGPNPHITSVTVL